jgi:Mannitol dehydrogenase Rossmann domain
MSASENGIHLSNATVSQLDTRIRRPAYDREKLRARTVHMSVGGFHRAHQAVYLDELLERGALSDWGECGMGVRGVLSYSPETPISAPSETERFSGPPISIPLGTR